jgi:hypothetical protein
MFLLDTDRLPLLDHADELEQQAEALERQDAPATRPGLVGQRQAEQQPQEGETAAGDKRPPRRRKPG